MNDRARMFAQMAGAVKQSPPADVMALGYLMRDWLEAVVADAGTSVDTGAGFASFDLWVKMGGKEVLINLRQKE